MNNKLKCKTPNLSIKDMEKIIGKTFKELFEEKMERENMVKVYGYYGIRWEPRNGNNRHE